MLKIKKCVRIMNQKILLDNLKRKSKNIMKDGKHFHDFAHVMGVYKNVEKLLKYEKDNRIVLLTSALFHDIERDCKNHGIKGARSVKKILNSIPEFPKNLISPVSQIIKVHDKKPKTKNEKLFYDADKMDAFNELAVVRSFMMYAINGLSLKKACFEYVNLIDYFYKQLNTPIAKKLTLIHYKKARNFARKLAKCYEIDS